MQECVALCAVLRGHQAAPLDCVWYYASTVLTDHLQYELFAAAKGFVTH